MAKRSDFALKLLDDLRLRKERMAAAASAQGPSSHSNAAAAAAAAFAGDVSGYTQQLVRGSKGQKSHEYVTFKAVDMHKKSNIGQRSLGFDEASQQIVPFRKGQSSQPMGGDLSTTLAFAFQNGGKIKTVNSSGKTTSVISFLRRIGKRPVDLKKAGKSSSIDISRHHRPSNSRCPAALSQPQVKEVSIGIQKLNRILRSCSNGSLSIDKYSIEIGKELLKGAVDLEEALKMLVALQDAPEYVGYPREKSHIKLVEVDDEGDIENDNMVKVSSEKKQVDLPRFSFDKPSRKLEKEYLPTSNSVSQRRSTSFGSGVGTRGEFTGDEKNSDSSQPNSEKGRISNVVAKLMGLDELVETADTNIKHRESISRSKLDGSVSKNAALTSVDIELKTRSSRNLALQGANKQVVKGNKVSDTKTQEPPDAYLDFFVYAGKRPLKNLESTVDVKKPALGSRKTSDKLVMEQKGTVNGTEKKQPSCKGELMRKGPHIRSSDISRACMFLGNERERDIILQTEKRIEGTVLTANQTEGNKPAYKKQRLQEMKHKGNEAVPMGNSSKLKLGDERSGTDLKLRSSSAKSASPRSRKIEMGMEKVGALEVIGKKPSHTASTQKHTVNRKVHNKTRAQKGAEHVIRSQSTKTVPRANGSERTGALNVEMKLQKEENQTSTLKTYARVESHSQRQPGSLTSDNSTQNIISGELNDDDKRRRATISCRDQDRRDYKIISDALGSICQEGGMDMLDHHPQSEHQKNHKSRKQEQPLTNEETYFKQILLKSHLFLYTAEALLDLNIPVAILQDSGDNSHGQYEENDKLMLDCGYEVMRRKGRRQELAALPHNNKTVGSLDDLVRQLHRDIENLRFRRRDGNGIGEWDDSDYLYKMIDGDLQNKDPDVNCMWDMGWTGIIFGFLEKNEVIRDVERQMLNGLIDEVISSHFLHAIYY